MRYKIYNGDCLEIMKAIPDNSIDLIFCDLPYGCTSCEWDCPIDLDKLWIEYMRIKKLHTPIFLTTTTKFGVNLINTAPKKCPFRYDICFVKSTSSGFLLSKKQPLRSHEMVYVFYEKQPFYDISSHKHKFKSEYNDFNNKDGAYGEIKSQKRPTDKYKNESTMYGNIDRPDFKRKDGESMYDPPLPTSVIHIKSERKQHSTQKPLALMNHFIKYYSKENDIILDNCMGSGSTGVACLEMKRRFIGIEKDKDIFKVAEGRLS